MGAWKGKFGNLEYGVELVGVEGPEGRLLSQEVTSVSHVFHFHQWSHITSWASF